MDCSACLSCGMVVLLVMTGCRLFHIFMVSIHKAVSTTVAVANWTLAYWALESGLRPHELNIDRPRTVRAQLNKNSVSTLRPERFRGWPDYMSLISE